MIVVRVKWQHLCIVSGILLQNVHSSITSKRKMWRNSYLSIAVNKLIVGFFK